MSESQSTRKCHQCGLKSSVYCDFHCLHLNTQQEPRHVFCFRPKCILLRPDEPSACPVCSGHCCCPLGRTQTRQPTCRHKHQPGHVCCANARFNRDQAKKNKVRRAPAKPSPVAAAAANENKNAPAAAVAAAAAALPVSPSYAVRPGSGLWPVARSRVAVLAAAPAVHAAAPNTSVAPPPLEGKDLAPEELASDRPVFSPRPSVRKHEREDSDPSAALPHRLKRSRTRSHTDDVAASSPVVESKTVRVAWVQWPTAAMQTTMLMSRSAWLSFSVKLRAHVPVENVSVEGVDYVKLSEQHAIALTLAQLGGSALQLTFWSAATFQHALETKTPAALPEAFRDVNVLVVPDLQRLPGRTLQQWYDILQQLEKFHLRIYPPPRVDALIEHKDRLWAALHGLPVMPTMCVDRWLLRKPTKSQNYDQQAATLLSQHLPLLTQQLSQLGFAPPAGHTRCWVVKGTTSDRGETFCSGRSANTLAQSLQKQFEQWHQPRALFQPFCASLAESEFRVLLVHGQVVSVTYSDGGVDRRRGVLRCREIRTDAPARSDPLVRFRPALVELAMQVAQRLEQVCGAVSTNALLRVDCAVCSTDTSPTAVHVVINEVHANLDTSLFCDIVGFSLPLVDMVAQRMLDLLVA